MHLKLAYYIIFYSKKRYKTTTNKKNSLQDFRIFMCMAVIWIPFLFIELNPTGYISWFATAAVVGVYAVLVVALSGFIFDCDDMKSTAKRILGKVK